MQKLKITISSSMSRSKLEEILGGWATRHDAEVRPMGRLVRRYKTEGESMHWHITGLRKGMGTVEVTYLPSIRELTVLVHDNRRGVWAGKSYEDLAHQIEESFGISAD